ncbi:unnamed protein product, partial [Arctia plantaginis]
MFTRSQFIIWINNRNHAIKELEYYEIQKVPAALALEKPCPHSKHHALHPTVEVQPATLREAYLKA